MQLSPMDLKQAALEDWLHDAKPNHKRDKARYRREVDDKVWELVGLYMTDQERSMFDV